jgi:ligand-binding sensor domain-containing protein
MTDTTSSSGWPSGRSAPAFAATLVALALTACGGTDPAGVLDLDPRAAGCYTSTRRAQDVRPLPGDAGIWAATEGGLLRFNADGTLAQRLTRRDGLASHGVRQLAFAPDGSLWIATDDGVSRLRQGRFESFTTAEGLEDDRCHAVEVDAAGTVYVGTERGVARFDGSRFEPLHDTHEFSRRATYDIHAADDGTLWMAKENALTHRLGESDWEVFQRDPLLPGPRARLASNTVRAVASDRQGRPWIGTREGLGHLDETGWRRIPFAERFFAGSGPLDNHVAALAVDGEGFVWIGHGDSRDHEGGVGAARFRGDDWRYFTVAEGLPDNRVHRIRPGRDGSVWLATAAGAARYRDGRFDSFVSRGDLPGNHVTGFARIDERLVAVLTPAGAAWFSDGRPLQRPPDFEGGARPQTATEERGPRGRPGVAARDASGALWVGTRHDGLWRHDDGGWTEVLLGGTPLPRYISALLFEDEQTLWVGTATEGAIRLHIGAPPAFAAGSPAP